MSRYSIIFNTLVENKFVSNHNPTLFLLPKSISPRIHPRDHISTPLVYLKIEFKSNPTCTMQTFY